MPFASVTDWRGLLAKIREDEPDIVIVTDSAPPNNAAFMNQFMENPPNSLLFLQYGPSVQEFLELTGDNSTGLIYNNLGAAIDSKEEVIEIRDRYEEMYGHRGGYFTVIAYDQVMIYATCLEEVGDPADRVAIGECLAQSGNGNAGWFLDLRSRDAPGDSRSGILSDPVLPNLGRRTHPD